MEESETELGPVYNLSSVVVDVAVVGGFGILRSFKHGMRNPMSSCIKQLFMASDHPGQQRGY